MATDRELVNFSEECKEKLGKRVLTQDEFDEFLKPVLNRLEDKRA